MHYWQEQAKKAAEDSRVATERQIEAEQQRDSATKERDKALMLAEIRYQQWTGLPASLISSQIRCHARLNLLWW